MTENKKYCMGCMKEIELNTKVCPHCLYKEETVQHYPCLPKGTNIANRYLVGRILTMANDSITYIGLDKQTEEIVSIHEFFPFKIVNRAEGGCTVSVKLGCDEIFVGSAQSFIKMWKAIGSISEEVALPVVRNILDYNGTIYTVCKYTDSITLKSYFEETRKPLSWQKAQSAFKSIFTALEKLHSAGVIHGSISPSSVHVGSDGKLHLTAFSIPECRSKNEYFASAPINGFSALELYGENRIADASSDVYSLMSLIYYAVTGAVPPKATERAVRDEMVIPSSVASTLPKNVVGAFIKGLAVSKENRIKSVTELYSDVYSARSAVKAQPAQIRKATSTQPVNNTVKKSTQKSSETEVKKTHKNKKDKKNKGGNSSLFVLAMGTFTAVVFVCMIAFCALYTTVLYKNYDVPVLNEVFASFEFLPMNKVSQNTEVTQPVGATQSDLPENRYVTVPDFTAHTYDSITANATFSKNFKINFSFEYNTKVAKNAVISQDLVKGESVVAGTTVNLVVSRGAEQIELPEVIGLKYDDASEELKALGFKVKKELIENDGTHEAGIVEMTDKVAGLDFDKGTEIVLSVWDEPEVEETEKEEKKDKDKNKDKKKDKNKKTTKVDKKNEE